MTIVVGTATTLPRPVDLQLRDRVCIVTGSTGGIGLETARLLVAEGARVVTSGRSEAPPGVGEALHVSADLSRPDEPERIVAATEDRFGGLDCLVNNVGAARQARFEEVADDEWDAYWQLNVMSHVRAIRAALPCLRRSDAAAIVNVSSTAGKRPSTGMPHYSVTKAAVLSLSRLVADLYAKERIRCNAVTPGPTATQAWLGEGGLADQQGDDRVEVLAKVGAGRPLGRLAEPREIAAVIAFLCSPVSSYVTGAAWSADGGTVPIII
jgi:3-oxoacyl-[acyl-carrier protein] reductase